MKALEEAWDWVSAVTLTDNLSLSLRVLCAEILLADWVVGDEASFKIPLRLLAFAALLAPGLLKNAWLWTAIAITFLFKSHHGYWVQDNHQFLIFYWTTAIALALWSDEAEELLAHNGRILLGAVFTLAAIWKGLLSPDFMSGAYFHFTFLTDPRFFELTQIISPLEAEDLGRNSSLVFALTQPGAPGPQALLTSHVAVERFTYAVTLWTQFIETAAAVCFLWPRAGRIRWARDYTLLAFSWTTYATIPNVGVSFGWLLLAMGLAQLEDDRVVTRGLYLASFPLILIYYYTDVIAIVAALL